ncbi:MAG: MaoC family dehydratase N-terminal domain-containing protein [Lachnospiraceae bacterium]|nr:MaoC family dehydratase N-terminal domain-containing protein [Candidatus Merdinaster equi]
MKHYSFEEMTIGMEASFDVIITEHEMEAFRVLSGDENPMHMDENYAKDRGFDGRVVYGMLAAAYYSRLVGMELPGEKCLINEVKLTFANPIYAGERLKVRGEVTDLREGTRRMKVKANMTDEAGNIRNEAVITVSFTEDVSS